MAYDFFYDEEGTEYLLCCLGNEFRSYSLGSKVPAPLVHLPSDFAPPSIRIVLGNPGGFIVVTCREGKWTLSGFHPSENPHLWDHPSIPMVDRWGNPFFGGPKSIGDPETFRTLPAEIRAEYQWVHPELPAYEQLTLF